MGKPTILGSGRGIVADGNVVAMSGALTALRIYGYLVSTWTRTACMTCIEKGVEYELVPIAYGSADHTAMHPFGRIPVLEHDGKIITEGLAITSYLDEAFNG